MTTPDRSRLRLGRTGLTRVGARTPVRPDFRRHVALELSMLSTLTPTVQASDDGAGAPLAESRMGSLFVDGGADATQHWYLPELSLLGDPDPDFAFAAVQAGTTAEGEPFNKATLTLGLGKAVPADVQTAMAAAPGERFQEIPLTGLSATLLLSSFNEDGSAHETRVPGQVTVNGDRFTLTVTGLLGAAVRLAFTALTQTGGASVELAYSYETVRWFVQPDTTPGESEPDLSTILINPRLFDRELLRAVVPIRVEPDPGPSELVTQPAFEVLQPVELLQLSPALQLADLSVSRVLVR